MPGKWGLHTFYLNDPSIRHLLPETHVLSRTSLRHLLSHYGSVYIKPNMEHTGKGIMKAWISSDKKYHIVRVNSGKILFSDIDALIKNVMKSIGKQTYIVQRTISLAQYHGRPYDIRVMMMRNKNDKWTYSGMLAKVMGPSSIISNIQRGGGYATTVGQVLKRSVTQRNKQQEIERKLIKTSYIICKRFDSYKYSSQIGIDFAVDIQSRIWIIEVNFDFPSHALFARLPDKTMYHLIKRRRAEYLKRGRRRIV
jgi:hypothetical protein